MTDPRTPIDRPDELSADDITIMEAERLGRTLHNVLPAGFLACGVVILAALAARQYALALICVPGTVGFFIAWRLTRRGAALWAAYATVLTATLLVTTSAAMGAGLRDPGVLAYPVIVIFAGLTLSGRRFFSALWVVAASMVVLFINQAFPWVPVRMPRNPEWVNALVAVVIMAATAYAVWMLAESTRKALATALREIERRRLVEAELQVLSTLDHLTGACNRRFFEGEVARVKASRHEFVSVIIADIDGLKGTNDALGHAAGDRMIVEATGLLASMVRAGDVFARIGGDEFAVLLPDTDAAAAADVLSRIRLQAAAYAEVHPGIPVQLSLGVATSSGANLDEALAEADARMYAEKHARRLASPHSGEAAPESEHAVTDAQPAT